MKKLLLILVLTLSALSPGISADQAIRDANGKIIAKISDTTNGSTVRGSDGKIIGRIENTAHGKIVRDENGRIISRIESPHRIGTSGRAHYLGPT